MTSTSLRVVSWGVFGFLYGDLGSACPLVCVRASSLVGPGFVKDGV